MNRTEAVKLLRNAVPAKALPDDEIGFFIEAVSMAIAALEGKDTNVPTTEQTIPVKWIESYLSDCAECPIVYYVIKGMLIKWREEQEGE